MDRGRLVGALALVSAVAAVASAIAEARASPVESALRVLSLLALLPLVAWLASRFGGIGLASACGAASLLLWASAGAITPWSWEWVWIGLSAVWWWGAGLAMRRAGARRLGTFTLVLAVAAAGDAIVTLFEGREPEIVFSLLGGWKIPLALAWSVWVGIILVRAGDIVPPASTD